MGAAWLRPARWVSADLPSEARGQFFGTAAHHPSAPGHMYEAFERTCAAKYLCRPRDCLVLQPPLRVPPGSVFPATVLGTIA
eukprot:6629162-Alexandrium_andersonii.AAC.1